MYFSLMALFSRVPPSGNAAPCARLLYPVTRDFRPVFSRHSGCPEDRILYAGSGTAALFLALLGLKRSRPGRNTVILPAWCCPSVPAAILRAGLRPVPADLDPGTFAYSPGALRAAVSESTLTILLIHFFAIPPPRPELPNPPPFFLRDCAQDFDFRAAHEPDCLSFYSFGRGKSLNAGHGGALCLPGDPALRDSCREILETFPGAPGSPLPKALILCAFSHPLLFGIVSALPFLSIGKTVWEYPPRLTRVHPGFFRWAGACFEALESHRQAYARLIRKYVAALSEIPGVSLPFADYAADRLPVRFPVLVPDPARRERLRRRLNRRFGGVTGQYPDILERLPGVPPEFPRGGSFPGCEKIAREILTLPVTAWLLGREDAFVEEMKRALTDP
jgi:perosamine synthetase